MFFLSQNCAIFGQDTIWPKVFNKYTFQDIDNTYDNGFVMAGTKTTDVDLYYLGYGIVKKLDINGEPLWEKYIGMNPPPAVTNLHYVNQTADGGYIVCGVFSGSDWDGGDIFIMKLNACGELEWNTYIVSSGPQINQSVYELEDGSFLTLVGGWGINDDSSKRVWLFKLSADGKILWQKLHADWAPEVNNNDGTMDFIKSPDGNYIISGYYAGYYDVYYWQPMFIKVDTAGNELWHKVVYGPPDSPHASKPLFGDTDIHGNVYSGGVQYNAGYQKSPIVYKVDSLGLTSYWDIIYSDADSITQGFVCDIKSLNDTVFYSFMLWQRSNDSILTFVYKLDSSFNTIDSIVLENNSGYSYFWPMGSVITPDNKYVAVAFKSIYPDEDIWSSHLWKLQSNLEYDTLYTMPRVYDSLCPYPIISDTIPLDTTTVINLEHIWESLTIMSVYPNPARNKLRIAINIVKWQQRQLIATNLNGQEIYNETIAPGRANHEVDISTWPPGIYVFSIFEEGVLLQTEKVVVVR